MTAPTLHAWHRDVFTKPSEVILKFNVRATAFGGIIPATEHTVKVKSARAVICQRVTHAMQPEAWADAQAAFDESHEGLALKSEDAGVRHEHCELWLLQKLFTTDHPDLVHEAQAASVEVLEHHAAPAKIAAHLVRLIDHVRDGKPLDGSAVAS